MSAKLKPATQLIPITSTEASDTTVYNPPLRGLWCNVDGTAYVDADGVGTNVKVVLSAGGFFPAEITKVYATGFTASGEFIGMR